MTEYIYLYISHPPVSEGDYPHSLKPTLFVGFIPVTRYGEAAALLGLSLSDNVFFAQYAKWHMDWFSWVSRQPQPSGAALCRGQTQTAESGGPSVGLSSGYDISLAERE